MAENSAIEWTSSTWNPITGCSKTSPGCEHCYAERMARRLQAMGQPNYVNGFRLTTHKHVLGLPLQWSRSRLIFVNSMSDLFHEQVPAAFIRNVFDIMRRAHWHRFQVLTKRSKRLVELNERLTWPPNVWMGVTIETDAYTYRAGHLRHADAAVKFLSLEPLLGPLPNLDLTGINWVVVGGESGPKSRPMDPAWVTDIRDRCQEAQVPFFFKQWGGWDKKKAGRILEGRTWEEMPAAAS